jgi:hypothetical protein
MNFSNAMTASMIYKLPRFVRIVDILTKRMRIEAGKIVVERISERQLPCKHNYDDKQGADETRYQEVIDQPKHIRRKGIHIELLTSKRWRDGWILSRVRGKVNLLTTPSSIVSRGSHGT